MLFEIGAVRFQPVSDLETRFRRVSQAFLLLYPHLFAPHGAGARAASAEEVELPAGAGHSGLVQTFCEQVQMRRAIERLPGYCGAVRAS